MENSFFCLPCYSIFKNNNLKPKNMNTGIENLSRLEQALDTNLLNQSNRIENPIN